MGNTQQKELKQYFSKKKQRKEKQDLPSPLPFDFQFKAKYNHNFVLTEKGEVYGWGDNSFGQLGFNDRTTRLKPSLLILPTSERVNFITSGCNFTLCVTESSLCYVWGSNECGQLGIGSSQECQPTILKLSIYEKIYFIDCGGSHAVCLTRSGNCYVWGDNECGQLGLGDKNRDNRTNPALLRLPNNEKACFISCGYNHTTCVTDRNSCYVWGYNYYGQLGLGDRSTRLSPALLKLPNNEIVSFITCGSYHTLFLTTDDRCYASGLNEYGELGFGDRVERLTPALLKLPDSERVFFASCGSHFSICLTENNLCYVWGDNKYGQLGFDDKNERLVPTLLKLPNDEKASFITCGYNHTICITQNNSCYVWGNNEYGQLGFIQRESSIPNIVKFNLRNK